DGGEEAGAVQAGLAMQEDRTSGLVVDDGQKLIDRPRPGGRVRAVGTKVRVQVDVAHAQFAAKLTFANGPPVAERSGQFGVGELVLAIDDRTYAVLGDGVVEAVSGHLTAAIKDVGRDDAEPLVV